MAGYEFGIDIGGTFTDVVCRAPDGSIRLAKVPTTRGNPSRAVLAALGTAGAEWQVPAGAIGRFTHGTTVATNAVLERKGARLGLIATEGFKDVIEIGRQMRHQMYDLVLHTETPAFLAPGRFRREVRERVDAQGQVLVPLDEAGVRRAVAELLAQDVQAIAVCLIFAFLHPAHERRIAEIIAEMAPGLPVSLSSEVDPAFREYERVCATAFDAYVKPLVAEYLEDMESGLAAAGVTATLQVMQSRGGLMSSAIARRRPVRLFLSGPAGGVVGGLDVGLNAGFRDLITVDIGGTSCDIALISDGMPLIRAEGQIDGFTVRVPMVDVTAIGSGGGSLAWIDAAGSLRVGPESAGSEPGPACYGRGGTRATVTDASVVLGYVDPQHFAGGTLRLQPELARQAVGGTVARPLGLTLEEAALGIHRVLNAQMAEAIRLVSIGRGIDPRGYALLPLGGGGPMHGCALAEDLGISTIIIPPHPGVLAAAGLLGAPVEHEVAAAFPHACIGLDPALLRPALAELDARCRALTEAEGLAETEVAISHAADLCYIGQSYWLEVPLRLDAADPAGEAYAAFLAAHHRVYGHAPELPAKFVNLRSVHRSRAGSVASGIGLRQGKATPPGTRLIRVRQFSTAVPAAIWQRESIRPGDHIPGPAIIEQSDTTTLVEPGWTARLGPGGALLMEKEARR
ncbi:hydantoinase/oxoprolinase family protein [Siccirubricoccus sp. KC 17139]|uniref:Hydantoinase/oxoprolinase family protein n=1 Tax=Siccirubricoccus soli TaxID=2899147 RepID=A0ABT1D7S4_9PROT|nr:hydantoinase/oxoprolinase family protein [Siccirubricoccus soli]MCO6417934.1 hydantoinase/oxoprolinase family protein [Siccirubricoccus soli]MCP2684069.1 hydantoinase/oxoprolinase family protein [Siccirubricoccus soli]